MMDQIELRKRVTQSVMTEIRDEIRSVWRRLSLGVILIFTVLIVSIMQRSLATRTETPAEAVKNDVKKDVKIALTVDLEAKAAASAQGFLEAGTVSEKAAYVMDAPRVLPLMEDYYQENPFETRRFKELVNNAPHLANDRAFIMSTVVFDDGSEDIWVFEKDSRGAVKLQWEVAVKYSEKDWDTFLETKDTEGGVFRVLLEPLFEIEFDYDFIGPDDVKSYRITDKGNRGYFNHEFTENDYVCFRVSVPGSERRIDGYLDKSSASFESFIFVRRMSRLPALPAIVNLRFPENGHGDQVHIADIQSCSWVPGVDM